MSKPGAIFSDGFPLEGVLVEDLNKINFIYSRLKIEQSSFQAILSNISQISQETAEKFADFQSFRKILKAKIENPAKFFEKCTKQDFEILEKVSGHMMRSASANVFELEKIISTRLEVTPTSTSSETLIDEVVSLVDTLEKVDLLGNGDDS